MKASVEWFAAISILSMLAMPLSGNSVAQAQTPQQEEAKKKAAPAQPAPAAKPAPAARPAPVARPAAPPPTPAPVARPAAPPRPAPAARVAPPRPNPPAARVAPQRPPPQRAATPPQQRERPAINRVERPQRHIERAQRNAPKPAAPQQVQKTVAPKPAATAPATATINPAAASTQERRLRQREDRALRQLPPKQRAVRREQIERAREQRVQQQQQVQPNAARSAVSAQPNATVGDRSAARANRAARRNGQARVTPQAARQGRFAALAPQTLQAQAVSPQAAAATARASRTPAHRAWRGGHRARFVGWYGPVFYPYAYADIFDYAFWPRGYDDDYWYVAYDDFFDGVYYGEMGPPPEYLPETVGSIARGSNPAPTYKAVADLCRQPGSGITAWPVAEIEQKVGLNGEQKQLLGDVKSAGAKAADVFKATCPSENAFPLTPPGRLASMTARLDATLEAVRTVRPPLEAFYESLTDEQKERFNEIGPGKKVNNAEAQAALPDDAKKCGEAKPGLTNLPIEQIEDALNPNAKQEAELDKLGEATVQAVGILQAACPSETPLTPPGRLQAIETRLQAMLDAARTVKPALDGFYASLSGEQKARFNRLGRDLAQTTTGSN